MTQTKNSRLVFIDLAKGATMLTILWGHVMLTGNSNLIVYAFHIPAFFFLAGMVYRGEKYPSVLSLIKRRFFTLLVPYGFYSVVTWLWWLLDCVSKGISLEGCFEPLKQTLLAQGSWGFLNHNPALWFVTCLFMVELMYYFIDKLPVWLNLAASVLLARLGWFMMQSEQYRELAWSLDTACAAVIFYACGNLLARHLQLRKLAAQASRHPAALWGVTLVSGFLLCRGGVANGSVSMAQGHLGENALLFYLIAFCGILFMLSLCVALEGTMGRHGALDRVLNGLGWLGRNSFYMMVLHIPVMLVCVRIVSIVTGESLEFVRLDWRYTLPAWVGMVIFSALLTAGIQKWKAARKS